MIELRLVRTAYTPLGTFGRLVLPAFECCTIEEVWRNNMPSVPGVREGSCIPVGRYRLRRDDFPTHKNTFEVVGVPGRTAILIHIGNTVADIEGCIAPGMRLGALGGRWAVLDSGVAYRGFMERMAGINEAWITLSNELDGGVVR